MSNITIIINDDAGNKTTNVFTSSTEAIDHLLKYAVNEWSTPYQFIRSINAELQSVTGINYGLVQHPMYSKHC